MDLRSIGALRQLAGIKPGACILFDMDGKPHLGMTCLLATDAPGILHFNAKYEGRQVPAIYSFDKVANQNAVHIESARLVPNLQAENICFGNYAQYASLAIYVASAGAFLRAVNGDQSVVIDLMSGMRLNINTSQLVHTRSWHIEVPNADGGFEPYAEFRQEA